MLGYPVQPIVMVTGYLMTLVLLIGLITSFVKAKYFSYKDMEFLLGAFILFSVIVVLATAFYLLQVLSFDVNANSELLMRGLGAAAAWLLAADTYRNSRRTS